METGRLSNRPQPDPALVAGAALRAVAQSTPAAPVTQTPGSTPAASTDAAARPQPQVAPSREAIEQLVERISEQVQIERHSLSFEVNDESGQTIVTVIDRETREVIRQIPSEELVRLAAYFAQLEDERAVDSPAGLLLREQA